MKILKILSYFSAFLIMASGARSESRFSLTSGVNQARGFCQAALVPQSVVNDALLFDIFRSQKLLPLIPPSAKTLVNKLSLGERLLLYNIHRRIQDPTANKFYRLNLSTIEQNLIAKLKDLSDSGTIPENQAIILNMELTEAQRKRAKGLPLPLIEGGSLAIKGSRRSPDLEGYHMFEAPDGQTYYSLQPHHSPYTMKYVHGQGMVELDEPAPISVEEIIEMHQFIEKRAVVPDAIAQPLGVHYVGSQLRVLYEIIYSDPEGVELGNRPSPEIIGQAEQIYSPGRFRGEKFNWLDDLQGDYRRIYNGKIRVGVPVRVLQFRDEVFAGEAFKLKLEQGH